MGSLGSPLVLPNKFRHTIIFLYSPPSLGRVLQHSICLANFKKTKLWVLPLSMRMCDCLPWIMPITCMVQGVATLDKAWRYISGKVNWSSTSSGASSIFYSGLVIVSYKNTCCVLHWCPGQNFSLQLQHNPLSLCDCISIHESFLNAGLPWGHGPRMGNGLVLIYGGVGKRGGLWDENNGGLLGIVASEVSIIYLLVI